MLKSQRQIPTRDVRVQIFLNSNRKQMILFAALTLILTVATVWGGRVWLRNSETLTFAVGDASGPEARFAVKLAAMLKASSSRLSSKIIPGADNAKALAQFDRKLADLAVLRTDAKIRPAPRSPRDPGTRRADADQPRRQENQIAGRTEEKENRAAAVFHRQPRFCSQRARHLRGHRCQRAPATGAAKFDADKLFSTGYGAVIAVDHASTIVKDKSLNKPRSARRSRSMPSTSPAALSRRYPGISEETLATGLLSSAPQIPDDDLDTVGLHWLLVGQAAMAANTAGELARTIYENKSELALDDGFASKIEPGRRRQERLCRGPSGRRRVYQRHLQVVPGAL